MHTARYDEQRIRVIASFLSGAKRFEATQSQPLSELVEQVVDAEPPITKVAEIAARYGVSVRTLQRLFDEYVGIGPKWVLDRIRVHAAAERARLPVQSWADVAQSLGYADQAHLTASLSATFGTPPAAYARAESADQ